MATLLVFGKHKNELLEKTPDTYIKWLATHRNVLSAEQIISTPVKVDLGLRGNFGTSRAFSLMR